MSRVSSVCICRPSTCAGLDVIAGCHHDLPLSSHLIQLEPPSEFECIRIAKERIRIHFHNRGKVELDGHILFYAVHTDDPCTLVYLCCAEPGLGFDGAQRFLDSIKEVVVCDAQLVMLVPTMGERDLQPHLDHALNSIMMAQNAEPNPQQQKMDALREQVESVKSVMAQNVQQIMERGERMDNIERRTEELHQSSANFKYTAHRVQRKMCLKNAKWTAITVVAVLIGLTIVILLILNACGVFDKNK